MFVAFRVESDKSILLEYANKVAGENKHTNAKVLKEKVFKYQKIYHLNDEYYINALDTVLNARQLCLSPDMIVVAETISNVSRAPLASDQELEKLFMFLASKLTTLCSRYSLVEQIIDQGKEKFSSAERQARIRTLRNTLSFMKASSARVDLSEVGGSPNAGKITNGFLTNDLSNVEFADVSVTGLFERRYTLGL
ncbi:Cas9 endonuclease PAM-interacting domain-containing protein [uncultured Bacteroides sp.]|uniref:Cas9 endonuclease PAM-interacting domain-containing protein n=1 Tax=uncultured Bacteroides sp. TaxID=162156 RepID=UPI002AAB7FD4|nr:Cas9 endonuclease PAM-interacting domain-containing protein [uncultured Bacteroides sp.]